MHSELPKTKIDERTGIEYHLEGDYYIPNLTILCRDVQLALSQQVHLPDRDAGVGLFHLAPIQRVDRPQHRDGLWVVDVVGEETGVQSQRLKQDLLGIAAEGLSGGVLDGGTDQPHAEIGVGVLFAGGAAGKVAVLQDLVEGRKDRLADRPVVPRPIHDAGGVGQEHLQRGGAVRVVGILQVGMDVRDVHVERELSFIHQVHGQHGRHRFGDGGDAVLGVLVRGRVAARLAVGVGVDNLFPLKGGDAAGLDTVLLANLIQRRVQLVLVAGDVVGRSGRERNRLRGHNDRFCGGLDGGQVHRDRFLQGRQRQKGEGKQHHSQNSRQSSRFLHFFSPLSVCLQSIFTTIGDFKVRLIILLSTKKGKFFSNKNQYFSVFHKAGRLLLSKQSNPCLPLTEKRKSRGKF